MRIAHRLARLDAEQDFLGARVGVRQIVAIIRRDQRNSRLARQAHNFRIDALFDFQALVLNLQKKIPFAENIAQAVRGFARLIGALLHQIFGDHAAQARGQRNQSAAVFGKKVVINPGLVIKTFEISRRHQLDEVAISFRVLAQQHQVVGPAISRLGGRIRAAIPYFAL